MNSVGAQLRIETGIPEYTHLDHQGSPLGATTSSGVLLWNELYMPYGEKMNAPAANDNDVGYTGHVQDEASGLTFMQARYYDPVAGRFLSTDPIGYQDQFNLYAYVANDPVNFVDPTGKCGSLITGNMSASSTCSSFAGPMMFAGQSSSNRASWDSGNAPTLEDRLEKISDAAKNPTDAYGSFSNWRDADVSARQFEGAALVGASPALALAGVGTTPVLGGAFFGAASGWALEAQGQMRSGAIDISSVGFGTVKGFALGALASGTMYSSVAYTGSLSGGIALGTTVNALTVPQLSGIGAAGWAAYRGLDAGKAYGHSYSIETFMQYGIIPLN